MLPLPTGAGCGAGVNTAPRPCSGSQPLNPRGIRSSRPPFRPPWWLAASDPRRLSLLRLTSCQGPGSTSDRRDWVLQTGVLPEPRTGLDPGACWGRGLSQAPWARREQPWALALRFLSAVGTGRAAVSAARLSSPHRVPPPRPPALLPLQVPQLRCGLRRGQLHQVPHPDLPLRGVPQVPHLPHGVQVGPQRPRARLHAAPRLQQPAVQVSVALSCRPSSSRRENREHPRWGRPRGSAPHPRGGLHPSPFYFPVPRRGSRCAQGCSTLLPRDSSTSLLTHTRAVLTGVVFPPPE